MSATRAAVAPGSKAEAGAAARVNPLIRVLPGLTDIVFLLPFIFVLRSQQGISFLLGDSDTGWHLKTGEWMLANGRVPTTDPFSYTKAGQPWFAWEWLWDLCFGWIHAQAGLAAVVIVSLLLIGVSFVLVLRTALRRCDNALLAFGLVWLGAYLSTVHWHARPHLVTLLFAAVFGAILDRVRDGRVALLWWLPPLTVVWTNMHGAFFVGIVFLAAFAAGELCGWLFEGDPVWARVRLGRVIPYVLTAAGCLIGSVLNPYGYHLHAHIFRYLFQENHAQTINEFQSLSFHHPTGFCFGIILALSAAAAFWHLMRKEFALSILILGWGWLALYSGRNIPIFVIAAIPLVAQALQEMLTLLQDSDASARLKRAVASFLELGSEVAAMERHWRLHLVSAAPVALIAAVSLAANPPAALHAQFITERFPAAAVDRFLAQCTSARIFAHDQWGGYLIYRLYPRVKVFVDGRSDFYGPKFGEDWLRIANNRYDWQQQLDKFSVNTVLLPGDSPLASTMKETIRWHVVYDDGAAIIFQPSNELVCTAPAAPPQSGSDRGRAAMKPSPE
ncbi:MAG: hypothetical protein ABSC08_06275 [Bryobacteraceae bacterium]|jgi:hypothetical protein